MNSLTFTTDTLSSLNPLLETIGWTLVHSIWQICAIGLLFFIGRAILRACFSKRESSSVYNLACVCMLMSLLLPVGTFVYLNASSEATTALAVEVVTESSLSSPGFTNDQFSNEYSELGVESALLEFDGSFVTPAPQPSLADQTAAQFYWLVPLWILGVLLVSLRPALGLWNVRRLRTRGLSELPEPILTTGFRIAKRFGISRSIEFAQSALVQVPTVIGFFKPVVLLPVSVTTGLSLKQIEQILAHELAHIRRHDYIINLAQAVVETIFFFHPAIWWMSRQIRQERENCCDDMAIEQVGDPMVYVSALMSLEDLRVSAPPALSVNGTSLINRVCRLLGEPIPVQNRRWFSVACSSAIIMATALAIVFAAGSPNTASEFSPTLLAQNQEVETQDQERSQDVGDEKASGEPKEKKTKDANDPVLVTVNGIPIKAAVVANLTYLDYRKIVLDSLIDKALIKEEATKAGLLPLPSKAVEEEIKSRAAKFGILPEKFSKLIMEKRNVSKKQLSEIFAIEICAQKNGFIKDQKITEKFKRLKEEAHIIRIQDDEALSKIQPQFAAQVNKTKILTQDVRNECIRRWGEQQLEYLINLTVLSSQEPLRNLTVDSRDIARVVQVPHEYLPSLSNGANQTADKVHAVQVYPMAILQKLAAERVKVSDQEIRRAYTTNYGVRAKVLAIVTDNEANAHEVLQIAQQDPVESHFRDLAKTFSTEPITKNNAGTVPPIRKYGNQPILESHAFDLRHGQFSDVIKVDDKFIVLFSLGLEHPKNSPDLEVVRTELLASVRKKKIQQSMLDIYAELRESAKIERLPFSIEALLNAPVPEHANSAPVNSNISRNQNQQLQSPLLKATNGVSTATAGIDIAKKNRETVDLQISQLVHKYNKLVDQKRFGEAKLIVKQAEELAPENEVVELLRDSIRQLQTRRPGKVLPYITGKLNSPETAEDQAVYRNLQSEFFRERTAIEKVVRKNPEDALAKIEALKTKIASSTLGPTSVKPLLDIVDRDIKSIKNHIADQSKKNLNAKKQPEKLRTVTYGVADLIVPVESNVSMEAKWVDGKWIPKTFAGTKLAKIEDQASVNIASAKPLEDLIKNTILPDSWQSKDGSLPGTIEFYEPSLSFVITHRSSVQAKIADLFDKLRELNEVTVESKGFIVFGKKAQFKQNMIGVEQLPDTSKTNSATIQHRKAKYLRGVARAKNEIELITLPNSFFFNGQSTVLQIDQLADIEKLKLGITLVVHPDAKSVRTVVSATKSQKFETNMEVGINTKSGQSTIVNLSSLTNNPKEDLLLLVWRPIVVVEKE